MPNGPNRRTQSEFWLEQYLKDHEYDYDYEPDLGVGKRPDFLVRRNGVEVVCEVKAFEQMPALERRISGTDQPVMASEHEVYGPMRRAVGKAARQLKPLAGDSRPLVVVLANPKGFHVHLNPDRLIEAMFGNPGYAGRFDPDQGQVEAFNFEYGRDGQLRAKHQYISAVAILEERSLGREAYDEWRTRWKEDRPPLDRPTIERIITEYVAESKAWEESEEAANTPEGNAYFIELLTTGSPEASPVPKNVFDGPRDKRIDVVRA